MVECLSSHAPQKSLWPSLPLLALSVFAPVSGHFFFTAHRTAARDMSVNVVERDLNHILVMRYGPVWYC